jgi:hypothetical protein
MTIKKHLRYAHRRLPLSCSACAALVSKVVTAAAHKALQSSQKPNFIVILTDDQVRHTLPAAAAAAAAVSFSRSGSMHQLMCAVTRNDCSEQCKDGRQQHADRLFLKWQACAWLSKHFCVVAVGAVQTMCLITFA